MRNLHIAIWYCFSLAFDTSGQFWCSALQNYRRGWKRKADTLQVSEASERTSHTQFAGSERWGGVVRNCWSMG